MSLFVKLLPAPASVPKLSTAAAWIGSVLLVQAILLAPDFGNLFGPDGYFRLELTNALQEPAIRHSQLAHWLEHNFSVELGPEVSFIAYCLALIGMVLNRRKGLFAVMALVTKSLWIENSPGAAYGADHIASIAISCVALASMAASTERQSQVLALLIRYSLTLCYTCSGIEKGCGFDWWNGNSIWRAAHFADTGSYLVEILNMFPGLAVCLGLGTLCIETFYAVTWFNARLRRLMVGAIVGLHLGIAVSMELYIFSTLMIVLNVLAWSLADIRAAGHFWTRAIRRWQASRYGQSAPVLVLWDSHCNLCRSQMRRLKRLDWASQLVFQGIHEYAAANQLSDTRRDELLTQLWVRLPDGRLLGGVDAFRFLSRLLPVLWPMAVALHLPLTGWLWKRLYRLIARHRYMFGRIPCESNCRIA